MFGFGIGIQKDQRSKMVPNMEKEMEQVSNYVLSRRLRLFLREGPTLTFEMF
jgi:hypothetical protein